MWIKKTDVGELWIETFFTVDKNLMWIKKICGLNPKSATCGLGCLWIKIFFKPSATIFRQKKRFF